MCLWREQGESLLLAAKLESSSEPFKLSREWCRWDSIVFLEKTAPLELEKTDPKECKHPWLVVTKQGTTTVLPIPSHQSKGPGKGAHAPLKVQSSPENPCPPLNPHSPLYSMFLRASQMCRFHYSSHCFSFWWGVHSQARRGGIKNAEGMYTQPNPCTLEAHLWISIQAGNHRCPNHWLPHWLTTTNSNRIILKEKVFYIQIC